DWQHVYLYWVATSTVETVRIYSIKGAQSYMNRAFGIDDLAISKLGMPLTKPVLITTRDCSEIDAEEDLNIHCVDGKSMIYVSHNGLFQGWTIAGGTSTTGIVEP